MRPELYRCIRERLVRRRRSAGFRLAALLLAPLLIQSVSAARWAGEWIVSTHTGYDSQVLVDPDQDGAVGIMAAPFGTLENRLRSVWLGLVASDDRLGLSATMAATGYRGDEPLAGRIRRANGHYHLEFPGGACADVRAATAHCRYDGISVLDQDRTGLGASLGWPVGGAWRIRLDLDHAWREYPGRVLREDSTRSVSSRSVDLRLSLHRRLGISGRLDLEFRHSQLSSGEPWAEYRDPSLLARVECGRIRGVRLFCHAGVGRRFYSHYAEMVESAGAWVDTGRRRKDDIWCLGAGIDYALLPQLDLFLHGSATRLRSSIEDLGYHQELLQTGIRVRLWQRLPPSRDPFRRIVEATDSLPAGSGSPSACVSGVRAGFVRFCCRAPHAASVFVMGEFNQWTAEVTPLADPDADGIWEAEVPLGPGVYGYVFVVDGIRRCPEGAEQYADDMYGGRNAVVVVRGSDGGVCALPSRE